MEPQRICINVCVFVPTFGRCLMEFSATMEGGSCRRDLVVPRVKQRRLWSFLSTATQTNHWEVHLKNHEILLFFCLIRSTSISFNLAGLHSSKLRLSPGHRLCGGTWTAVCWQLYRVSWSPSGGEGLNGWPWIIPNFGPPNTFCSLAGSQNK